MKGLKRFDITSDSASAPDLRSVSHDRERRWRRSFRVSRLNCTIATAFEENRISSAPWITPSLVRDVLLPPFAVVRATIASSRDEDRSRSALRSRPVNSTIPRQQCSTKRFTMVLWSFAPCAYELELAIRLTPLPNRPSSPASSVDPGTSSFSSLLHALRRLVVWIDGLLTLVWQMLSPTVNVTSLGAMIHGPVGISRYGALQKGPAGLLYLRLNFMCSSARGTLSRFVPGLAARVHSSRCEILQLEVRLHRSYRAVGRQRAVVRWTR